MSTSLGWKVNHRSGIALAMRQIIAVYSPTGSMAYVREMSTLPTFFLQYGPPLPFKLLCHISHVRDKGKVQVISYLKTALRPDLNPVSWHSAVGWSES